MRISGLNGLLAIECERLREGSYERGVPVGSHTFYSPAGKELERQ